MKKLLFLSVAIITSVVGVAAQAYDAQLKTVSQQYTAIPLTQVAPLPLSGVVTNLGTNPLAAAKVTATVFNASNVAIQTYSSTPAALASAATATFTAGTWTPPATVANYTIKYVVSHTNSASDALRTNDTITYPFSVTSDIMARDNGVRVNGLGLNGTVAAPIKVRQGQEFTIAANGTLASVDVQIGGGGAGDTIQLEIYTVTAGVVNATPLLALPAQTLAAAAPGLLNFPLPTPLAVTAGTTYMVSLFHSARGTNIGMGYANAIFTAAKVWIKTSAGAAWAHPEDLGPFAIAYMIRLHLPRTGADAEMLDLVGQQYTLVPQTEVVAQTMSVKLRNKGTVPANTTVTVKVTNNATSAVVYTNTSVATAIAAGVTQTVSNGAWTPSATATGAYLIQYIANATADIDRSNDTINSFLIVSPNAYARDNGSATNSLGINGAAANPVKIVQGVEFDFPKAARMDSVSFAIGGGGAGDTIKAQVYLVTGGVVGATPIMQSNQLVLSAPAPGFITLPLISILTIPAGSTYMVALWHSARGTNIGLACSDFLYRANKNWIKTSVAAAWNHPEAFGFNIAYILRPHIICPLLAPTVTGPASIVTCATPSVSATAAGGANYAWSTGAGTAVAAFTAQGIYTVTATDAIGCTGTATVTVDENKVAPTVTIAAPTAQITCVTASVTVTASGTGNTYAWTGATTGATKTVIAAGIYTVTATTTANGCTASTSVAVASNTTPPPAVTATVVGSTGTNGSITITNPANNQFAWSNGGNTGTISGLAPNTYTVTVTDGGNGCTRTASFAVVLVGTQNAGGAIANFAIAPNPANNVLNISYTLQNTASATIEIANALGQVVATKTVANTAQYNEAFDISNYPSGTYLVQIVVGETRLNQRVVVQH